MIVSPKGKDTNETNNNHIRNPSASDRSTRLLESACDSYDRPGGTWWADDLNRNYDPPLVNHLDPSVPPLHQNAAVRSWNIATAVERIVHPSTRNTKCPSRVTRGIQTAYTLWDEARCSKHRRALPNPCDDVTETAVEDIPVKSPSGFSGLAPRASFRQLRSLTNVNFSRWMKNSKQKPRSAEQVAESYLSRFYRPYPGIQKCLASQVKNLIEYRYHGDLDAFEEQYLVPLDALCQSIKSSEQTRLSGNTKKERRSSKKNGWPFCSRGCVVLHLCEIDCKHLRNGDFYFQAESDGNILLLHKTNDIVYRKSLNAHEFTLLMAGMASSAEEEDEDGDVIEKDIFNVLDHLMVSVDRGIRRIHVSEVAKELWNRSGGYRGRKSKSTTRDSWVQTTPPNELDCTSQEQQTSRVAPLASEEEFSSDTEHRAERTGNLEESSEELLSSTRSTVSINELDEKVVQSEIVILPGCRDLCGRSVVFLSLQRLKEFTDITPIQISQLILYFTSIPKKDVSSLGILLLVDAKDVSTEECNFLEKCLSYVEACAPRTVSVVLSWQNLYQESLFSPTSPLRKTRTRFEVIVNVNQLLKYIRRNQLLPCFGGTFDYNHHQWVLFHKVLDPFVNSCRLTGEHLLAVMRELRSHQLPPSSNLSCALIEHHKRQIVEALEDKQLRHLEVEGDNFLEQLKTSQKKWPQNHDYRESVEKCGLLYRQLKKILQRLTKLADKRLGKLQECMVLRTFEEESSQVLSWLCHKGEETLRRHKVIAENFSAIKEQEDEFQKFYFLAMRQIERGNDLLDEAPKPKIVSSTGINGLTSVLKDQLEEFTERLEEARERLEDSRRCYHLLDQSYEWALETIGAVSCMKYDSSTSLECLTKTLHQLESFFKDHPPFREETFEEMIALAKKLGNVRLTNQCEMAKKKCRETVQLVQARLAALQSAKIQLEEQKTSMVNCKRISAKPYVWLPVVSSTPYRAPSESYLYRGSSIYGSQQILREPTGSYTAFPSSYYPVAGFKDNRTASRSDVFKGSSLLNDSLKTSFLNTSSFELVKRASFASVNSLDSRPEFPEDKNHQLNNFTGLRNDVSKKRLSLDQSWKICEDELDKATEEVRIQNNQLEEFSERFRDEDESETKEPTIEESVKQPRPVNMHLLRCASCSDFEELLSTKNAELEAQKKTKKLLKLIMREMIQTETDYVRSLEYIIENYVPLLQKPDIPQALRGQRNVVFGNIEKIYEFHNCYFLQELEQCVSSPFAVGQCFLKYEPQFYLYALYNKNKPKSDTLMAEYGSRFFKEKQRELGDKMDLASYLLKPVQRMGKYALLLKQLLKECPEGDCDYTDLKAAEEMVHFQLRHGNDLLAMDALRDCDVNVKEQGRLLRQDEFLIWQGKSKKTLRHLFLFEDTILFSKARRDPASRGHDCYQYKQSIKTSDIGLTEQVGDSPTKFEIWFRKRKTQDTYTLQAPSSEVKNAWVQDISKLLWKQALRNRELRLAEMSSMGIGNKPCLDISPSQDQICDRSISLQQLNKAGRFRNSIALSSYEDFGDKRPQSVISVGSSSGSSAPLAAQPTLPEADEEKTRRFSMAQQSQCSAESGIFTDASMSGESLPESERRKENISTITADSRIYEDVRTGKQPA